MNRYALSLVFLLATIMGPAAHAQDGEEEPESAVRKPKRRPRQGARSVGGAKAQKPDDGARAGGRADSKEPANKTIPEVDGDEADKEIEAITSSDVDDGDDDARASTSDMTFEPETDVAQRSSAGSIRRGNSGVSDSAIAVPGQERQQREPFDVQVFGYLRVLGSAIQSDPNVSFVGRNDGFRLLNARVGIDGWAGEHLYLRISADGADDERASANDVEGTLRVGLKDAFVDVHAHPAAQIRVGRFPIVFDMERFVSSVQWGFIRRSIESRGVSSTEGFEQPGLGVSRNLGVAVRAPRAYGSNTAALGYEIAAQNGNGSLDANNDSDALAYSATLLGTYRDRLLVFGGFRYNERNEGDLPFRRTEVDLETAFGVWVELDLLRIAGQLIFRRTTFETTAAPSSNAYGGHAEVQLKVPFAAGLRVGYRYGILDESDRIPQNSVQEHTVGVAYEMPSVPIDLKLNLTLPIEDEGRELENSRAEALLEVRL